MILERKEIKFRYGNKFVGVLPKDILQWCVTHYPEEKTENKTEEELLAIISKYQGPLYFFESWSP